MKKILYLSLLFSSSLFAQHLGEIPVNSDLGGYYHFNGNSTDATSNANNGTGTSIIYGLSYGKFSQGALFNGTSSVISANGLKTTLLTTTTGTVSIWFNNTSTTIQQGLFTITNAAGVTSYFAIILDWRTANKYIDVVNFVSGTTQWEFITTINSLIPLAGSWHNIIVTQNGISPILYIDGNVFSITFTTSANKTAWFSNVLTTGTTGYVDLTHPSIFYKGMLDEYVITKSKVWSASDVRKYYTQTKGRFQTTQ